MSHSIACRMFRFLFPKRRFSSGSVNHPTPIDLFTAMLQRLVREERWQWVNFDVAGTDGWIQVAFSDQELALNFAYTFDDDPVKRLSGQGIHVPRHWRLDYLTPRKAATFVIPAAELQDVASMVHEMFQRLFGCSPNYDVRAFLE